MSRDLFPIMRVLHSLWGQTMNFVLMCFVWLCVISLVAGVSAWLIYEVFGGVQAYRNDWRGRVSFGIREFFLL